MNSFTGVAKAEVMVCLHHAGQILHSE